jgi:photosystem II stability/assembly factor-like uncharacterized protein
VAVRRAAPHARAVRGGTKDAGGLVRDPERRASAASGDGGDDAVVPGSGQCGGQVLLGTDTVGWASTDRSVLRTKDTGATWFDVSPPGWTSSSGSSLVDADTAYLASDSMPMTIAATHDGGADWVKSTIDAPAASGGPFFAFQTTEHGFATFSDRIDDAKLWVYATSDGGHTWTGPRIGRIPQQPATMTKLEPPSGGVYFLVRGKGDGQPYVNRYKLSMDGGATWEDRTLPTGGAAPKAAAKEIDRIWVLADGTLQMAMDADDRGSIWSSHDAGRTWALIRAIRPEVPFSDTVFASATTWIVAPVGSTTIWTTEDAGAHWRTISVSSGIEISKSDVSFASANVGWGVLRCGIHASQGAMCAGTAGQSVLMRTANGGETWLRVDTAPSTTPESDTPNAAGAGWADAGTMPGGQYGLSGTDLPAVALDDGRVLVVGLDESDPRAVLYDPVTDHWVPTDHPAHARTGPIAVRLADGRVLLAGGSYGDKDRRTTELFDPSTGHWSAGPSMQRARSGFQAVALSDGRVLVVGGEPGPVDTAEIFDPDTRSWKLTSGPRSTGFGRSQLLLLRDGRVFTAGGTTGSPDDESTASAEIYDPATGRWTRTTDMNERRSGASAVQLSDGRVLLVGGARSFAGRELPDAEVFDPRTATWSMVAPIPMARTAPSVAVLPDGRVLVAGGSDPMAGVLGAVERADIFDPSTGTWTRTADLRTSRYASSAVKLRDGTVLLVGGHTTGAFNWLDTAERFYPDGPPAR